MPFEIYAFQEKLMKNFHKNRFNICEFPRQTGKALAFNTPIPTPERDGQRLGILQIWGSNTFSTVDMFQ